MQFSRPGPRRAIRVPSQGPELGLKATVCVRTVSPFSQGEGLSGGPKLSQLLDTRRGQGPNANRQQHLTAIPASSPGLRGVGWSGRVGSTLWAGLHAPIAEAVSVPRKLIPERVTRTISADSTDPARLGHASRAAANLTSLSCVEPDFVSPGPRAGVARRLAGPEQFGNEVRAAQRFPRTQSSSGKVLTPLEPGRPPTVSPEPNLIFQESVVVMSTGWFVTA